MINRRKFITASAFTSLAGLFGKKSFASEGYETVKGKPVVILMKTVMGAGVDFMEGHHEWHGIAPNDEQLAKALAQLPETLGDY